MSTPNSGYEQHPSMPPQGAAAPGQYNPYTSSDGASATVGLYAPPPNVGYPQPSPTGPKGMSIASMIIGLASTFLGWLLIPEIVGLVLGIIGLRKEPDGRGFAIAGIVINGLMLLTYGVVVMVWLVVMGAFGIATAGVINS